MPGSAWFVIVAERTLVIASELRDSPVGYHRPVVAEGFVHFELDGFVFTLRVLVRVGQTVRMEFAAEVNC